MPKQQTHVKVVREWCQSLGILSAVSISRQEAEMKLAAYVPILMERFPDAAFTIASLEYVAAQAVKGFPTYGELAAWLSEWWTAHRPPSSFPQLPPPPPIRQRGEPTPEEIAHAEQVVAETIAALRANAQPIEDWRTHRPQPRYLTPEQLDRINPLPNGVKRHATTAQPRAATEAATPSDAA